MKRILCITLIIHASIVGMLAQASHDPDTAPIDAFISAQARRERGEEYKEARKVVVGDLNHDGIPDVAVLYTIEGQRGSNNYVQNLAVFVRTKGKLVPAARARVGGRLYRAVESVQISDNVIHLDTLDYTQQDAACCPSKKGATSYSLNGRTLREK